MPVKAVILVLLVLGGGVALWQLRADTSEAPKASGASGAPSAAVEAARTCLEASPGYQVRTSDDAKGVVQLLVTTPSGSSARAGNVTTTHQATVFLTFFESPEQAKTWSSLAETSAEGGGASADNEMIGTVFLDWSVEAPAAERETVRGCVKS